MTDCITLSECSPADRERRLAQAEEIFFETASTKNFTSAEARQAFFQRWFGNYVDACPGAFLFALDENGGVTGYLAGCPDSFSPASVKIIGEIDYFNPFFCAALKNHPAHFHVNVNPGQERKGIGRSLVAKFAEICGSAGSSGIHVVTGATSPTESFYEACRFSRVTYAGANPNLALLIRATVVPQNGP